MSDFIEQGRTFGRARLLAIDGVHVAGQLFFCLGLFAEAQLSGLIVLVAAALVGLCIFNGIRDSATAVLGGRRPDGEPDPRLSLAASLVVVAIWIAVLVGAGVGVGVSLLDLSPWGREAMLAAGACGLVAAVR